MNRLQDVVPCGILVFSDRGTILSANQALTNWLGYTKDQIEGRSIESILSLATRIFYQTHFFPILKLHQHADEIFLAFLGKENKEIPMLSNTVRELDGEHHVNISVLMPVYNRKRYEDEILEGKRSAENALKENKSLEDLTRSLDVKSRELDRQYQKMVTLNEDILQFSKILSHDLQEPIRKIRLFSSILSSSGNPNRTRREESAIRKIDAAAERLKKLTHGLQEYVTVDTEKVSGPVDINAKLESAKQQVIRERNFSAFQIHCEPLPELEGYPAQLEVLFYHLIDNAVQFRKPEQDLIIRIDHAVLEENIYKETPDKYKFADHIRIVFSDNGIGFDNQYNDYVFELVKKIDASTQGLGFGLPLIKKIVDNHAGSIALDSAPGKGTRVTLFLPLRISSGTRQ